MARNNPLIRLEELGQSVWLDFISREMLSSGRMEALIREDGLSGVTSNPSIFEKSIDGSGDYDRDVAMFAHNGLSAEEIYRELTVGDVRQAADLLRPDYERTGRDDGYVSIEVSPRLAHDTDATVAEARSLWKAVARPNVMVKVPGTREGIPAIAELIGEGINVNVTLLFGLTRYREAAEAYISGLESLADGGKPSQNVRSVASFFLSRIDVLLDPELERLAKSGREGSEAAARFLGRIAVSSAKAAYVEYGKIFSTPRFERLAKDGARPQRLLWASTSTKNPAYSDVKYVEALIGKDTVNTMPLETLEAYRDHGRPAGRLRENVEEEAEILAGLPALGIDLEAAVRTLEDQGVDKFIDAYDRLISALGRRSLEALGPGARRKAM
jgi:transaldolase